MRFISGATIVGLWILGAGTVMPALAADPPASMPRFEVSGIMLQEDGKAWALIAEPQWTGGAVRLVTPGAMIGPYRLVEVQRDHVILQSSSEAPLRVPFSWRGGGGGTAVAAQPPADRAAATRTQTRPTPTPTTPPTARPVASVTDSDQEAEKAGESAAGTESAPAAEDRPAAASAPTAVRATAPASAPTAVRATVPPRAPAAMGYDPAKIEALRRERERMFKQELSIEGFHTPTPSSGFQPASNPATAK